MAKKHPERSEGAVGAMPELWLKTDRCGWQLYGCPMPPMGKRGLDEDDDTGVALIHNLLFNPRCTSFLEGVAYKCQSKLFSHTSRYSETHMK